MDPLSALPVVGGVYKHIVDWYKGPRVEVVTQKVFPQYDRLKGPYKPVDFRLKVKNTGIRTVSDLRASIYFRGIIESDNDQCTLTVDTKGVWEQKEDPSISLHGDEHEWLNILRVVQDYTNGKNFDPDTDVHLIFPTYEGWSPSARIRKKWSQKPTTLTKEKITQKTAEEVVWQEARIKITGKDKKNNKVSFDYNIDFESLRDEMDNRAVFFNNST